MTNANYQEVNNIQSRTTMPLFFFNNYYLLYKSSFPSVTRLVGMTEIETEPITDKKTESEIDFESVILSGISYSYDGDQNVLSNVSLEIDKGDKVVITGDNMSGKSTLIKILAGLIEPDSGEIYINGKRTSCPTELRKYFTLLLQNSSEYQYFGNNGSGGEVALNNLKMVSESNSKALLLDEPDASLNKERLHEVEKVFTKAETAVLISHRQAEGYLDNNMYITLEKGTIIE